MNLLNFFRPKHRNSQDALESILYNEETFYHRFTKDLLDAKEEVVIESPFITSGRLHTLKPIFEELVSKGINVFVVTKHPGENDEDMNLQSEAGIRYFELLGVQVLL